MWTGPGAARSGRRAAGRRRQGGIVLVLYALAALTIVGMAGFALDVGIAYLSKTRLHNALDAAALAGAKTLFQTESETTASTAATTVFNTNIAGVSGGSDTATVQFSDTLTGTYSSASVAAPSTRRYVKVTVSSLPVTTRLIGVFGFSSIPLSGTATAGPEGTSGGCGGIPIALCGTNNGDSNCTDGNGCFGIAPDPSSPVGEAQINASSGSSWSPGNYGYVAVNGGGTNNVRDGMAGGLDTCVTVGTDVNVETGSGAGAANGLDTRFTDVSAGWANGYKPDLYAPPSLVTPGAFPAATQSFSSYEADTTVDNADGLPHRRVARTPVFDCSTMPSGSSGTAHVIGTACLFLTRRVGNDNKIYGQFIASDKCEVTGGTPTSGGGATGFRTVLYN